MIFAVSIAVLVFIYAGYRNPLRALFFGATVFHISLFTNLFAAYDIALSRILVLSLLCSSLLRIATKKERAPAVGVYGFLLLFFLFLAGFSLFYAGEPSFGVRKMIYFISVVPVYFIVTQTLGTSSAKIRRLFFVRQVHIGMVVAALGSLQFLLQFVLSKDAIAKTMVFLAPYIYGNNFGALVVRSASWFVNLGGRDYFRAISIFPDPHTFAVYLGFVIPPLFSFLLIEKKRSMIYWAGLAVSLLALLFTFSRGGYLSLFCFFVWFLLFGFYFLKKQQRYALVSVVLGCFLLLLLSPFGARFMQSFDIQEHSFSSRVAIMTQGIELWANNPILGVGVGNYPYAVNHNAPYRSPINAHNTYIEIGAEMGVFGLFLWLAILFIPLLGVLLCIARAKKAGIGQSGAPYLFAVGGSFLWFMVSGFFETTLYWPAVLLVLLVYGAVGQLEVKGDITT